VLGGPPAPLAGARIPLRVYGSVLLR